jgi:8-oxo-dGTP diphosphatase
MKKGPALTVDAVVEKDGKLLLVRRGREPFKGRYALPGGFVECGETTERAVLRELVEETGVKGRIKGLLCVRSDPSRDPRGHTVSVVYAVEPISKRISAGDDAEMAEWVSVDEKILSDMAFDHAEIVREFLSLKGRFSST